MNKTKRKYIKIQFYYKIPSSQASGAIPCDNGGAICAYERCDDLVNLCLG
jgi:hypothetical protein